MEKIINLAKIVAFVVVIIIACGVAYVFCVVIDLNDHTTPVTDMLSHAQYSHSYNSTIANSVRCALNQYTYHDVLNVVALF